MASELARKLQVIFKKAWHMASFGLKTSKLEDQKGGEKSFQLSPPGITCPALSRISPGCFCFCAHHCASFMPINRISLIISDIDIIFGLGIFRQQASVEVMDPSAFQTGDFISLSPCYLRQQQQFVFVNRSCPIRFPRCESKPEHS